MARWEAFQIDPEAVHAELERGNIDYVEVAGQIAETRFFRFFLEQTPWKDLVASFPSPRKKEEVPLWLYLCSQVTLRLHGQMGYGGYPYVVHCGGLKEVLGNEQFRWKEDPRTGQWTLECEGYNDKNDYARLTPCDADFLRKMARDTGHEALQTWFGWALPRWLKAVKLWDEDGIVIADGTYLFVPDNEHYENSSVLRFDEHNHPVNREKLSAEELKRTRLRRCYRMVNLVHTDRRERSWTYAGMRVGAGSMAESPQLCPMVLDLEKALGPGHVRLVIHDRGFIDGHTASTLKEHGIDTLFPLKSDMNLWEDALHLAQADDRPWQVWRPPAPQPPPIPPQRPPAVQARENKRQRTLAERGPKTPAPVRVDRVEMKLIPKMQIWDSCRVPVTVVVLRKHLSDGERIDWGLATTRDIQDPLEAWILYELRNGIEERHRQTKCFWDLTHFRSPHFGLVVNQIAFTLLAYSLMQAFLAKVEREDLAGVTRQRLWDSLLPQGDKIVVYAANYAAFLTTPQYSDWLLGVSDGARRQLRGRIRAIERQRLEPPLLPQRP